MVACTSDGQNLYQVSEKAGDIYHWVLPRWQPAQLTPSPSLMASFLAQIGMAHSSASSLLLPSVSSSFFFYLSHHKNSFLFFFSIFPPIPIILSIFLSFFFFPFSSAVPPAHVAQEGTAEPPCRHSTDAGTLFPDLGCRRFQITSSHRKVNSSCLWNSGWKTGIPSSVELTPFQVH